MANLHKTLLIFTSTLTQSLDSSYFPLIIQNAEKFLYFKQYKFTSYKLRKSEKKTNYTRGIRLNESSLFAEG